MLTTEKMAAAYIEAADFTEKGDFEQPPDFAELTDFCKCLIRSQCSRFWNAYGKEIGEENVVQAGHDLYYTTNGHGVGFWDRPEVYGQELAEELTKACTAVGPIELDYGDREFQDLKIGTHFRLEDGSGPFMRVGRVYIKKAGGKCTEMAKLDTPVWVVEK